MRSIWKGVLSAGLVNIPVRLGNALADVELELHRYRTSDGSRMRMMRVAEADGKPLDWDQTSSGFEAPDGSLVLLGDEDFEAAYGEKNRVIRVMQFAEAYEIPRAAAGNLYYIQPDTGGAEAYAVLAAALALRDKVAVVQFALRDRIALGAIRAEDGYLVLERMRWAAELKSPDFAAPQIPQDSLALARAADDLLVSMSREFRWEDYTDTSKEALMQVIQDKLAKTPKPRPAAEPAPVSSGVDDLMATLQASVEAARKAREPQPPARKVRSRVKKVPA